MTRYLTVSALVLVLSGLAVAGINPGAGQHVCTGTVGPSGIANVAQGGGCMEWWPEGGGPTEDYTWIQTSPPPTGYWKSDDDPPKIMTFAEDPNLYERSDGYGEWATAP